MDYSSIWVICDGDTYDNDHILQLISKGYQLCLLNHSFVTVVYMGRKGVQGMKKLSCYGAKKVIHTECSSNDTRVRCDILIRMVKYYKPTIILFPATKEGKYMAAVLSTEFESGLTAECIDITLDEDKEYIFSRAALNSSVIASIKCINSKINMCTVKKNVFAIKECEAQNEVELEHFQYYKREEEIDKISQIELIDRKLHIENTNTEWQSANLVFAIGRGVADQNTVEQINKLADRYGAEVVGTRAAVEEGLVDKNRQVGQSGVSICPNVYVGFGVSGASQHMVGIKNSKIIIAINNDEGAPIFNYADYAVKADVKSIIYELEELNQAILA